MKKKPRSLFDKVNSIWDMVSELPGLMKGIRREMRGLRKRMDELEHQVHSKILQEKERQLSEPPDPAPGTWIKPTKPWGIGGGTVMYGVVDTTTDASTWTYNTFDSTGTTITVYPAPKDDEAP
jgi:hypothetical protein